MVKNRDKDVRNEKVVKTRPVRNRASPYALTQLYNDLTNDQKNAIREMGFGSLLDIKCQNLHNALVEWINKCYDRKSRSFVIPGRGRIPLTEDSVHNILGIPHGSGVVVYAIDSDIEESLSSEMFPIDGRCPTTARVAAILKDYEGSDDIFKRIWLVFAMSTVLAPTTLNKVSSRVYPVLADIDNVHNLNWCKFVSEQMHDNLSAGRFNKGCHLYAMLLYVSNLDLTSIEINVPVAPFVVNAWTKELVDMVAIADSKDDRTFGELQLISEFSGNYTFFGGAAGFDRWMELNIAPDCPEEDRKKVATLIGNFAAGVSTLMSKLVQDWTSMSTSGKSGAGVSNRSRSAQGVRMTRARTSKKAASCAERSSDAGGLIVSCEDFGNNESDFNMGGVSSEDEDEDEDNGTKDSCADQPDSAGDDAAQSSDDDDAAQSSDKMAIDGAAQSGDLPREQLPSQLPLSDPKQSHDTDGVFQLSQFCPSDGEVSQSIVRHHGANLASSLAEMSKPHDSTCNAAASGSSSAETAKIFDEQSCLLLDFSMASLAKALDESLLPSGAGMKRKWPSKELVDKMSRSILYQHCSSMKKSKIVSPASIRRNWRSSSGRKSKMALRIGSRSSPRLAAMHNQQGMPSRVDVDLTAPSGSALRPVNISSPMVAAPSSSGKPGVDVSSPSRKSKTALRVGSRSSPRLAAMHKQQGMSSGSELTQRVDVSEDNNATPEPRCNSPRMGDFTPPSFDIGFTPTPPEQNMFSTLVPLSVVAAPHVSTGAGADVSEEAPSIEAGALLQLTPAVISEQSFGDDEISEEELLLLEKIEMEYEASQRLKSVNVETEGCKSGVVETEGHKSADVEIEEGCKSAGAEIEETPPTCIDGGKDVVSSTTPRPQGRDVRVVHPSRFLCAPFGVIKASKSENDLYNQVIRQGKKSRTSKIKYCRIIQYWSSWITLEDLADRVKPRGQLSNTLAEIAIYEIKRHHCADDKLIFTWIEGWYLMSRNLYCKPIRTVFRRDNEYKLTRKNLLLFPVLQRLGAMLEDPGHWYVVVLNLKAKRFEVLDSIRDESDDGLNAHANEFIDGVKAAWNIYYAESKTQVVDYELEFIPVNKQKTMDDCGYHMIRYLEVWDGRNVPIVTDEQIRELRKIYTSRWLNSADNTVVWRNLIEKNRV